MSKKKTTNKNPERIYFKCEHCGKSFVDDKWLSLHYDKCVELEKLTEYE